MTKKVYTFARSAKTGRFVTMGTAKRHPDTTVVEAIKRGTRKKKK